MIPIRWRRALASALCVVLMLAMMPSLGAEVYPFIGYTTDSLRLRDKPNGTAEVLQVIPKGESLAVTGADGSYYIVEYNGQPGFAMQSFITRTAPGASGAAAAATPVPVKAEVAAKYPPLANGSTGPQVKALQQALKELNFYRGTIDSKYGDNTGKAVEDFQEKNKLPKSGMADSRSQELMFEGRPRNAAGRALRCARCPPSPALCCVRAIGATPSSTCSSASRIRATTKARWTAYTAGAPSRLCATFRRPAACGWTARPAPTPWPS